MRHGARRFLPGFLVPLHFFSRRQLFRSLQAHAYVNEMGSRAYCARLRRQAGLGREGSEEGQAEVRSLGQLENGARGTEHGALGVRGSHGCSTATTTTASHRAGGVAYPPGAEGACLRPAVGLP